MEKKTYERPIVEVMNIETESLMVILSAKGEFQYKGGGNGFNRVRSQSRNAWSDGWD